MSAPASRGPAARPRLGPSADAFSHPRPAPPVRPAPLRLPVVLALLPGLLFAAGCRDRGGAEEGARAVVTVSAASSLREVMAEVERAYEAAHPDTDVRVNLGSSGALRQQIEQGAEVDVFVSAAERPVDALEAAGRVDPRSRRVLAGNRVVLVVPAGRPSAVASWASLGEARVGRVALGAPASVPAGEYALEALRSLGIAEAVAKKAVYAQNVRQVLAYVESGNVDAGIVYATDAAASRGVRVVAAAPPGTHRPVTYVMAVVRDSRDPERAMAVAGFLAGAGGREAFRRRGFVVE